MSAAALNGMIRFSATRRLLACTALLLGLAPGVAWGQPRRGEITGTVTDSARQPLADADVFLRPAGKRTRSDSAGAYRFTDVADGSYSMVARKIGYKYQEADVVVQRGSSVRQDFALPRRVILATVEVTARGECPMRAVEGFFCRQEHRSGVFLDYPDIDHLAVTLTGDLFRQLRGWRVTMQRRPGGWTTVPVRPAGRCVVYLVDGRAVRGWDDVPPYASDLTGMEVYVRPDTVPPEILRELIFYAGPGRPANPRSCEAVVFWTRRAGG